MPQCHRRWRPHGPAEVFGSAFADQCQLAPGTVGRMRGRLADVSFRSNCPTLCVPLRGGRSEPVLIVQVCFFLCAIATTVPSHSCAPGRADRALLDELIPRRLELLAPKPCSPQVSPVLFRSAKHKACPDVSMPTDQRIGHNLTGRRWQIRKEQIFYTDSYSKVGQNWELSVKLFPWSQTDRRRRRSWAGSPPLPRRTKIETLSRLLSST
jgi:hypothetical protein